jgi:acetate kinase
VARISAVRGTLSCERLKFFGIEIDPEKNEKVILKEGLISPSTSSTQVYVIPTNEELLIARDAVRTVLGASQLRTTLRSLKMTQLTKN